MFQLTSVGCLYSHVRGYFVDVVSCHVADVVSALRTGTTEAQPHRMKTKRIDKISVLEKENINSI